MKPHIDRQFELPARLRVKRAALFQEAYAQGHKQVGRYAVLWMRKGEDACGRLGVVASKRVGNSVARSRGKRRLREWFRLNHHRLLGADDVILVARYSILNVSQAALDADLEKLFIRAGQLQCSHEDPKCSSAV
ncbi:ribonuclease P protein component [Kiritimatiellota bacterium B12222]|nr:ribonuclease P protein component [Kiritimatiellota bacterium B12222]